MSGKKIKSSEVTPENWLEQYNRGYGSDGRHWAMAYARGRAKAERAQMHRDALLARALARRAEFPQEKITACAAAIGTSRQVLSRMLSSKTHAQ